MVPGLPRLQAAGGVTAVPLFGKGRGEGDGSNVDCDYFFGITAAGILVADFEGLSRRWCYLRPELPNHCDEYAYSDRRMASRCGHL